MPGMLLCEICFMADIFIMYEISMPHEDGLLPHGDEMPTVTANSMKYPL